MIYRHELKHKVHPADYVLLRNRLKYLMQPDPHGDENGCYRIRSLYFDNPEDRALREKIDGVSIREKFRIRIYNGSDCMIRLEKKCKNQELSSKSGATLTKEQAEAILALDTHRMAAYGEPLLGELSHKMQSSGLRPKTLVEYRREAYVYGPGNVRITFDTDLRTGLFSTNLFGDVPLVSAAQDTALLEVKFDAFIPEHIVRLLQLGDRRAGAFSKYAACRLYG